MDAWMEGRKRAANDAAAAFGMHFRGALSSLPQDHMMSLGTAVGKDGDGYGTGAGAGDGDGDGDGDGAGDGDGYGYGDGNGYGNGYGDGDERVRDDGGANMYSIDTIPDYAVFGILQSDAGPGTHRGWTRVGWFDMRHPAKAVALRCRVIIEWGTKGGIGELRNGPTSKTLLGSLSATPFIPLHKIQFLEEACVASWSRWMTDEAPDTRGAS